MEDLQTVIISVIGTVTAAAMAAVARLFTAVNSNTKEIDYIKKELNKLEGGQDSIRASVEDQRTRLAVISTKLENLENKTDKVIELLTKR